MANGKPVVIEDEEPEVEPENYDDNEDNVLEVTDHEHGGYQLKGEIPPHSHKSQDTFRFQTNQRFNDLTDDVEDCKNRLAALETMLEVEHNEDEDEDEDTDADEQELARREQLHRKRSEAMKNGRRLATEQRNGRSTDKARTKVTVNEDEGEDEDNTNTSITPPLGRKPNPKDSDPFVRFARSLGFGYGRPGS